MKEVFSDHEIVPLDEASIEDYPPAVYPTRYIVVWQIPGGARILKPIHPEHPLWDVAQYDEAKVRRVDEFGAPFPDPPRTVQDGVRDTRQR